MIEPKVFYRELDSILAKITKEKPDKNLFQSILAGLEQEFGKRLSIAKSHVYEQRGDDFVLVNSFNGKKDPGIAIRLSIDSESVRLVLNNGSYVYDRPVLIAGFGMPTAGEYAVPAAIFISSPDRQWLIVFELKPGWIREEIILFLNAVRTAINYRLFSELMGSELERVRQIQRSLFPASVPKIPGYQIAALSKSAEMVGGDFFDFFQFDDDSVIVCIGDASGHGLSAALRVRDVVIGLRVGLSGERRMVPTLKKINGVIQRTSYSTNFVSLFMGEFESDGHLIYVNAGQPPPFVVDGGTVRDLEVTGIPLGFMPDIKLHRSYIHLPQDSILVLYSDGIIERQNSPEDQFGIERLKKTVFDHRHRTPKEIVELVFDAVFDYANRKGWDDDASLLVIKRTGLPTNGSDRGEHTQ